MSIQLDTEAWTPGTVTPTASYSSLVRSEISRVYRRRLLRVLAALLLGGVALILGIAFLQSSKDVVIPPGLEERLERRQDQALERWNRCVDHQAAQSPATSVQEFCGPEPVGANAPQLDWYINDPRFLAVDNVPPLFLGVAGVMATVAFIIGASVGGAEWSSRSMTLQLLWEPRRFRLLSAKWLALIGVMIALSLLVLAVGVALASLTVQLRGSWEGVTSDFWSEQIGVALRGGLLIALAATTGLGIATALRNTGAALGAAFVYFAVAEFAVRFILAKYGPEPYLVSGNSAALLLPEGLEVPGKIVEVREGGEGTYEVSDPILLTHGRAAATLTLYEATPSPRPTRWPPDRRPGATGRPASCAALVARVDHVLGGGHAVDVADEFPSVEQKALLAAGAQTLRAEGDRLTVVAADRPGLFSRVAGVLSLHGLGILDAAVGGEDGWAIEVFRVQSSFGPTITLGPGDGRPRGRARRTARHPGPPRRPRPHLRGAARAAGRRRGRARGARRPRRVAGGDGGRGARPRRARRALPHHGGAGRPRPRHRQRQGADARRRRRRLVLRAVERRHEAHRRRRCWPRSSAPCCTPSSRPDVPAGPALPASVLVVALEAELVDPREPAALGPARATRGSSAVSGARSRARTARSR